MIMPSYSTLPESMLSPAQLDYKFGSPTMGGLRGLGNCGDCLEENEDGSCAVTDTSGCAPVTIPSTPVVSTPTSTLCPYGYDANGNCITGPGSITCPNGITQPAGTACAPSSTSPTSTPTSSGGLTPAQQAQLDAGILKGGLSLAQQLALQPGQSLIGSNVVSGGVGTASLGLSQSLTSMMPMILIVGIVFLISRRGK